MGLRGWAQPQIAASESVLKGVRRSACVSSTRASSSWARHWLLWARGGAGSFTISVSIQMCCWPQVKGVLKAGYCHTVDMLLNEIETNVMSIRNQMYDAHESEGLDANCGVTPWPVIEH